MIARSVGASLLRTLWTNRRGNTLMLFAFALLPMMGMIGGALDISRAYLVKSRLQHACDAAVLGGRRSMTGSDFDATAQSAADRFFNVNFTPGRYGSTGLSMQYQSGADMIVHGTAGVTVPTVIMKIFGVSTIPLQVTCDAQLQLPNSDIMFVLDTTLSMADTNPGDTQSKIATLRSSVTSFYNTLEAARSSASQVRYGFVPYSSTVNVGMLLKREWMVDTWTYQSREWKRAQQVTSGPAASTTTTTSYSFISGTVQTLTSKLPAENCFAPANTLVTTYGAWSPYTYTTQPNGDVWSTRTIQRTQDGSNYSVSMSGGVCTLTEVRFTNYKDLRTDTTKPNPNAGSTTQSWTHYYDYRPIAYNVSVYKGTRSDGLMAGGSFDALVNSGSSSSGSPPAMRPIPWNATNACIEERHAASPNDSAPGYDMDVDLVPDPSNPQTQWHPSLPQVVFARGVNTYNVPANQQPTGWIYNQVMNTSANYVYLGSYPNDWAACPSPARKLAAITTASDKSALQTYLNALTPKGRTYHDVGMLWGLRLMSAQGLFASENQTAPNGGAIARHLIFMTDGDTETNIADYDAYGLSALDRRRTWAGVLPTNSQQDSLVETRLLQLCSVAKDQKNITVWVIAFGTTLTPLLTSCASDGRAYQANNAAQLNQTFADIAARISQLRVTH